MNTEQVRHLLQEGQTPRQIAKQLGYPRKEVEQVATELASAKRTRSLKRVLIPLLALLVVGMVSLIAYNLLKEPDDMEVYKNIVRISDALPTAPAGNSWFINHELRPKSVNEFAAEVSLIQHLTSKLDKALSNNTDVPRVKEEQEMFGGHFTPTIFSSFQGGSTRMVGANPKAFEDPGLQEVIFYGHFALNHPRIKHRLLFYDPQWRALIIAALNFTDEKWYDAIMAHELWHAKMHRENNPTSTAPMLSEPWVTEELWAHEIEFEVLNARTSGSYKLMLRKIVNQRPAKSLKRFLAKLEPNDFRMLDSLFKPGLSEEVDIRAAQYALNLAHIWLDGKYTGEELRQKRIEAYRFLIDPSQSTNVQ